MNKGWNESAFGFFLAGLFLATVFFLAGAFLAYSSGKTTQVGDKH